MRTLPDALPLLSLRTVSFSCWLLGSLAACTSEREPATLDAETARAFYAQNQRADFTAFDGVTVRVVRPVVQREVMVLGHVYAISFCSEVVDVSGYRGINNLTYYYSDWPPEQHHLMRRARPDSLGRVHLGELFTVPARQAPDAFATWAADVVTKLKGFNLPHSPTSEVRTLQACVSKEGHSIVLVLASGLELLYLPADTENSLFWTKQRRQYQRLGPYWYWRRPPAAEITEDNPAGM